MPTTNRFDHGFASNEGPNDEIHVGPTVKAYGPAIIARQTSFNESDEAVALEAARRLGVTQAKATIRYYGEQLGLDSIAHVTIAGRSVRIRLKNGLPIPD